MIHFPGFINIILYKYYYLIKTYISIADLQPEDMQNINVLISPWYSEQGLPTVSLYIVHEKNWNRWRDPPALITNSFLGQSISLKNAHLLYFFISI